MDDLPLDKAATVYREATSRSANYAAEQVVHEGTLRGGLELLKELGPIGRAGVSIQMDDNSARFDANDIERMIKNLR